MDRLKELREAPDRTDRETREERPDRIEILPVSLLDEHRALVETLEQSARRLEIGLGWHYLLDLSWIVSQLGPVKGLRVMDAGAGVGLMQWYLAGAGAEVLSVDANSRAMLPLRLRARFRARGLRPGDLAPAHRIWVRNVRAARSPAARLRAAGRGALGLLLLITPRPTGGRVVICTRDLEALPEIPDDSLDAVVAVSSLEHNEPAKLGSVVDELMRTLKPGGVLLATLGAARDSDWFHQPSKGWNYTEATLRRLFRLPEGTRSNYSRHDELLAALRGCAELRDHLAPFYFESGDNGMPWGVWDPQYQPVGVRKTKA